MQNPPDQATTLVPRGLVLASLLDPTPSTEFCLPTLRFKDSKLQSCYTKYLQENSEYPLGFLVFAFCNGPLWLLHCPTPRRIAALGLGPLFSASFWTWLFIFEVPMLLSFAFLAYPRWIAKRPISQLQSSLSYWCKQVGLIGGVLTVGFLLLARSVGPVGITQCTHYEGFQVGPCNAGASGALLSPLDTAILLVLPMYFHVMVGLARPMLFLSWIMLYSFLFLALFSLAVSSGFLQKENLLIFLFGLTWVVPPCMYERVTAKHFVLLFHREKIVQSLALHVLRVKDSVNTQTRTMLNQQEQILRETESRLREEVEEEMKHHLNSYLRIHLQNDLETLLASQTQLLAQQQGCSHCKPVATTAVSSLLDTNSSKQALKPQEVTATMDGSPQVTVDVDGRGQQRDSKTHFRVVDESKDLYAAGDTPTCSDSELLQTRYRVVETGVTDDEVRAAAARQALIADIIHSDTQVVSYQNSSVGREQDTSPEHSKTSIFAVMAHDT
eukprot:gb/GEZN01003131.1/.p1 GENE.gb/GEZN01003131.1/~~gb/GEZN01003131.1/.p1  ORF type:complete len:498 (-),score=51.98 gb/GEZN01003131.1/:24-1517(-)